MEDMERYGDYTEYEDDIPKSKSKFVLVMKILIAFVCLSVIGILAFPSITWPLPLIIMFFPPMTMPELNLASESSYL